MGVGLIEGRAPSSLRRWMLHRRLKIAAKLLDKSKISRLDYAAIAVGVACDLCRIKPSSRTFSMAGFGVETAAILGADISSEAYETYLKPFGPLMEVPMILGQNFPVYTGTGDQYDAIAMSFTWGTGASFALRRAQNRLRAVNRWTDRADAWLGEQAKLTPNLYDDLWKWLLWLVSLIATFLLGWWSARG